MRLQADGVKCGRLHCAEQRARGRVQWTKAETEFYVKGVAGVSPATQIADAKALLDAGTISRDEYARLKEEALA
jgi:hypothetical protein